MSLWQKGIQAVELVYKTINSDLNHLKENKLHTLSLADGVHIGDALLYSQHIDDIVKMSQVIIYVTKSANVFLTDLNL